MKKLISIFAVVTMLCSYCAGMTAVSAAEPLTPTMVDPYTYVDGNNKYGIVMICDMPNETITSATLNLYDSSDAQVATQVYTEGNWVTAGAKAFHTFAGLTKDAVYKAEIILGNGTDTETTTVENIKVSGFKAKFPETGYSIGNWNCEPRKNAGTIGLMSIDIDENIAYSGTSSVKYHTYGWYGTGGAAPSNRYDWTNNALWFNGMDFGFTTGTYWEFSFAFTDNGTWDATRPSIQNHTQKGTIDNFVGLNVEKMTKVSSTVEKQDNGWYLYKGVWTGKSETAASVHPKVTAPNGVDTFIWFDDFNIKKINDYNAETGEYSSLGNNVCYSGDFETQVQDLAMYEQKMLTWNLGKGWFAGLNIYKDGVLIDSFKSADIRGITKNSYEISDENWDEDSTYTVKVIPGAGGGHAYHNPSGTVEGPGVSVTGITEIEADNYNGAKPTDLIALGYKSGINAVWNMPSTNNVLQMKAELIDRDGKAVQEKFVYDADGINAFAIFPLDSADTNEYSVKVTIIYSDKSAGVATFEGVTVTPPMTKINGMYFGNWMIHTNARNSALAPVWNAKYDTEVKKTGTGSLYFDFRGWAFLDGSKFGYGSAPGNTFMKLESACAVEKNKYYEVTVTVKDPVRSYFNNPSAATFGIKGGSNSDTAVGNNTQYVQILNGAGEAAYSVSETDDNGWRTTKAIWSSGNSGTFYGCLFFEWSSMRECWLDSYTVKEVTYNADTMTYEVTGNDRMMSGDMAFDVTDAYMDEDGTVYWTNSNSIKYVNVYDAETGELVDKVDATAANYSVMTELGKTYVLKSLTMRSNTEVSTAETEGVTVAPYVPVPDSEIGEISVSKDGTTAQASVTVKNNKLKDFSACLILAEYDSEGAFVKMLTDETAPKAGDEEETLAVSMTVGATSTVKAFLWDGLENMKPID